MNIQGNLGVNPASNNWLTKLWKFCFPTSDLVQACTTNSDTQLIDAVGKGDAREPREGRAYYLNGSDNYIDTGVKVQGQIPIQTHIKFLTTDITTDYQGLIYCGSGGSSQKGIYIRITKITGELLIAIGDGIGYGYVSTGIYIY